MKKVTVKVQCKVPDSVTDDELSRFMLKHSGMGYVSIDDVEVDDNERLHRIAFDVRKSFTLNKCTGKWHWFDRDTPEELSDPFDTHYAALCDAVAPYVEVVS